jgi:hypothetical protein
MAHTQWSHLGEIPTKSWRCAYCDKEVASNRGWVGTTERFDPPTRVPYTDSAYIAICPRCELPTTISERGAQVPGVKGGEPIEHLPDDVRAIYEEARSCMSVHAATGAVLLGRKLLMHVAVAQDAKEGESFKKYVDHLAEKGIVTAGMKEWVDEIRELGNDANHEIIISTKEQAEELLTFVGMLLKVVYEYPAKGRRSVKARQESEAA